MFRKGPSSAYIFSVTNTNTVLHTAQAEAEVEMIKVLFRDCYPFLNAKGGKAPTMLKFLFHSKREDDNGVQRVYILI